jgi:hypothetical protein
MLFFSIFYIKIIYYIYIMPERNKKNSTKKGKDKPTPKVTLNPDRPFVKPLDPSWNPQEERTARLGWCVF